MESSQRDTLLERALQYPYSAPINSFVFTQGTAIPIDSWLANHHYDCWQQALLSQQHLCGEEFIPVIAYGSNRSPAQLRKKYGRNINTPIISIAAILHHHDIVRSAHFTSYATLAATILPAANTKVEVFVQYLSPNNLNQLHQTEALGHNYDYISFPADCISIAAQPVTGAMIYQGLHGHLQRRHQAVAFAELSAQNRSLPEANQADILRQVHEHLEPQSSFEDWLIKISSNLEYRQQMTMAVKKIR